MKTATKKVYVITAVLVCALIMSIVDGVIQPGYAVKSAIKAALFLAVPLFGFLRSGTALRELKRLFVPKQKELFLAVAMGVGVYGLILGGYWVITQIIDLTDVILKLTADGGVSAENFGAVSLYIALVNSMLEEFFFRGFAFLTLKDLTSRRFAYLFSAILFAAYHTGMLIGSTDWLLLGLAILGLTIAGLVLNFLNEKSGNIITSWLVHMFANLGINTIGFMVFGML